MKVAAGRIGGLTKAARHSPSELTGPAQAGFLRRFRVEVDPEGILPEAERERRANAALRAHMARLAMASAEARRKAASQ